MIEAELKARVHAPQEILRRLGERADGRVEVYQDTYYATVDGSLEARDEELRVRTVHGPDDTRTVLKAQRLSEQKEA
ncbi:CYTH domain-containing protein [Streptomyces sp. Ag109_G2-6]|uniref:CYTH domain-containing protein n=1 Tax=Streptomyces TaxID=1883 RepID=UPI0009A483F7|nr:CYTH domain-containing protein [Streptomyces sp. Ag109_G2-6]RPF40929.1 CYTH domain-containing protein [Streptomyces sp. Ag109_G2-6]